MTVAAFTMYTFFERGTWYLCRKDPALAGVSWRQMQRMRRQDSRLGLLPTYRELFGTNTLAYFRPGFHPDHMGSTAQAVAYLASSPAARAATL
jgi:predicted metal-dependent hydrolase